MRNLLKLVIPYLIAILSFTGGKYQFNSVLEILIFFSVIVLLGSYSMLIFENEKDKNESKSSCKSE